MDKTLELLLRPISKLLIKNDISIQRAVEALKQAMVDVASEGTGVTDSYVSLKTGVHRKDVRRLRADRDGPNAAKRSVSAVPLVISYWANTQPFSTGAGRPVALPRNSTEDQPGFDALVRASKVDLPPATILQELIAQGFVDARDGMLRLTSTTYIPETDDGRLAAFDATISDHIRIAVENATEAVDAPRQFDRVLRYSHLSQSSVARLEQAARIAAMTYLEDLNRLAHDLQKEDDMTQSNPGGRFVSGVFIAPVSDMPESEAGT